MGFNPIKKENVAMDTSIKILIVDDFATMRRILKNILKQLGFKNNGEAPYWKNAMELL